MVLQLINRQHLFQILTILCVSLLLLTSGLQASWTSRAIPIMLSNDFEFLVTIEEATYLTILPSISMILTSFIPIIMDHWGRKPLLIFTAVNQVLSWALIAYGSSIYVFYAARVLNGITDTSALAIVPVFVAEIATPANRSSWGTLSKFFFFLGNFLAMVIGSAVSVRIGAAICMVVPLLFLSSFTVIVPESPCYLLMKGDEEKARASLLKYRNNGNVDEELQKMKQSIQDACSTGNSSVKNLLFEPANRRAICAGAVLRFAVNLCGFTAFVNFGQLIFDDIGSKQWSPSNMFYIFSATTFLSTTCGLIVIVNVRRRVCLITSQVLMGLVSILMGTYFLARDINLFATASLQIYAIAGMFLYAPFFGIGIGILPLAMMGELFAMNFKRQALMWMNLWNGLSIIIANKVFQVLMTNVGLYSSFYFTAFSVILTALLTYFAVPETYKKSLDEIQTQLKENSIWK